MNMTINEMRKVVMTLDEMQLEELQWERDNGLEPLSISEQLDAEFEIKN